MRWNSQTPLIDYYEGCYRRHKHLGCEPATIADYRTNLRKFCRLFQEREGRLPTLADVTDEQILATHEQLIAEGRVPETCNKYRRLLLAICRFARTKQGGKVEIELPEIARMKEPKHERRVITAEQLEAILAAAADWPGEMCGIPAGLWWPALILTTINTAARISTVMRLTRDDVDLQAGVIRLRHQVVKDKSDQLKPILPLAEEAIRKIYEYRRGPHNFLLPSDLDAAAELRSLRTQEPNGYCVLRERYKKILAAAGVPVRKEFLFHGLRAFTATRIVRELGIKAAQAYLDHSSDSVTWRYIDKSQAGLSLDMRSVFPEFSEAKLPPPEDDGPVVLRLFAG